MISRANDMALVLSRVNVRYADAGRYEPLALKDITFSVRSGAFVAICGPSGAGKSTLMRTILGLMQPESGTIVRDFSHPAMVFQNYALFPWLTALENVAFGLRMGGMRKEVRLHLAREKLKEVGLGGFEKHYPAALSGGQRQRVGLARALAISPDLLILDEPFSNLDTITAQALKEDLLRIWRTYGMTIIMVNHLIPDTVELADQVIIMDKHPGRIEKTMTIDLVRPRNHRSHEFFHEVDRLTDILRKVS